MKIIYPSNGKLSNYSYKSEIQNLILLDNTEHDFFSQTLTIVSPTIQIEGSTLLYCDKYATEPALNVKPVSLYKGPALIDEENICVLAKENPTNPIPLGTPITTRYGYKIEGDIPLKVIEINYLDPTTNKLTPIKVAGIDYISPYDIPINIVKETTNSNISKTTVKNINLNSEYFIPQGTSYVTTTADISESLFPVTLDMKITRLEVNIYKNTKDNLVYYNSFFCNDTSMFYKSDISFVFVDKNVTPNSSCKYIITAKTNTASKETPVILKYSTITISQIK